MEIKAQLVKELREKTSAGMMDCKRALVECNGDLEKAAEYLRKKGLVDASKKSSRTAADGLISIAVSDDMKTASILELNSETDFVAKNEKFQALAARISEIALNTDGIDNILNSEISETGETVKDQIASLISLVGENMSLRRVERFCADGGVISTYVHNSVAPNLGKIGVIIGMSGADDNDDSRRVISEFGKKIAMQVTACSPSYLSVDVVPEHVIEKEKEIIIAQAKNLGKPVEIAEKMAIGRIKKFFEEVVLLEQIFFIDNKIRIADMVDSFAKEIGKPVKITGFVKYVLGEGIEKTEKNFADEVMSFIK
jgi:elongation factor Ts